MDSQGLLDALTPRKTQELLGTWVLSGTQKKKTVVSKDDEECLREEEHL